MSWSKIKEKRKKDFNMICNAHMSQIITELLANKVIRVDELEEKLGIQLNADEMKKVKTLLQQVDNLRQDMKEVEEELKEPSVTEKKHTIETSLLVLEGSIKSLERTTGALMNRFYAVENMLTDLTRKVERISMWGNGRPAAFGQT